MTPKNDDESGRFRFDPSLSWGDVGMAIGMIVAGVLAYAALSSRVSVTEVKIDQTHKEITIVSEDLRVHKLESSQDDLQIKSEFRDAVRDINMKLEKIVDRQMMGSTTNGKP